MNFAAQPPLSYPMLFCRPSAAMTLALKWARSASTIAGQVTMSATNLRGKERHLVVVY